MSFTCRNAVKQDESIRGIFDEKKVSMDSSVISCPEI